jgi:hypothetical protein
MRGIQDAAKAVTVTLQISQTKSQLRNNKRESQSVATAESVRIMIVKGLQDTGEKGETN